MAKRVGVMVSGCGARDGSDVLETVLVLLGIERAGGRGLLIAPEAVQSRVIDHRTGAPAGEARQVLAEAARLGREPVRELAGVRVDELDALVVPGGGGVVTVLSNYAEKGAVCDIHPEAARLLRESLARRRPIGLVGLAPLLAARVLGPVAGVRLTLGPRGSAPDKHAAVMGADVRPCPLRDVIVDERNRVVSTPAHMYEDARLLDVSIAIDKLVRAVFSLARGAERGPGEPPRRPPRHARQARGS